MRIFIAIDLAEEIRARLDPLIERLHPAARGLRWVHPTGMHLTLKFIGETSEAMCDDVSEALEAVRLGEAIPLAFRGLGFFPNERHPRVFWVGVEAPPNLAWLAERIETALEPLGIAREQRPFSPHMTLGRFRNEEGLAQFRQALASIESREFGRMEARAFHLFRSHLSPRGAQYEKLKEFDFASPP